MADEQADPLVALLDKSGLSTAQKHGLWDLYTKAKNTDDLKTRLDSLQLPNAVKHDLWDLKAGEMPPATDTRADGTPKGGGFFGTLKRPDGRVSTELSIGVGFNGKETQIPALVPSLSQKEVDSLLALGDDEKIPDSIVEKAVKYAQLRMQAGKSPFAEPGEEGKFKPLPFEYDPNRQRSDRTVLGVDPEFAALGVTRIGGAALSAGAGIASRTGAAGKAAVDLATPVVKAEAIRRGLRYVGLPGYLADVAADIMVGYKRGATAGEATAAAEGAAAETTPMGFPKATEPALSPLEMTRKVREDFRAMLASQAKTAADKPKLTVEEMSLGAKLLQAGMKSEEALQTILKRRELPKSWQILPTDAEVAGNVGARNASGAWPK